MNDNCDVTYYPAWVETEEDKFTSIDHAMSDVTLRRKALAFAKGKLTEAQRHYDALKAYADKTTIRA